MIDLVKVLILYYSRTGNVEALARAVAEGVESVEGASAEMKRVDFTTVYNLSPTTRRLSALQTILVTWRAKISLIERGALGMLLPVNQPRLSPAKETQAAQL